MMSDKQPWYKKEIDPFPIKTVDVLTFTKNFSLMLQAGLTVPEALEVLLESSDGKIQRVLKRVYARVNGGERLSEVLAKEKRMFSPLYISAVHIGERSGTLGENLFYVSTQMEQDVQVKRDIQSALFYPVVLIVATTIVALAMATYVLPQLVRVFDSLHSELPWMTRVVIWLAHVFEFYGLWIIFGLGIFSFLCFFLLRTPFLKPFFHRVLLSFPLLNRFFHEVNRARFCRTIGTLLESGVPIEEGLRIGAGTLTNEVYRRSVEFMSVQIASGQSLASLVECFPRLYPKMIQRMIMAGERSGGVGPSLLYLARYYEQRVSVQAKNFSTMIEPLLLLFIGLVVGFIALAIFVPIYSITETFRL